MSKLRVLDLFSGVGGFSLGLERTGGFETVAFCENDPFASRVLAARFPGVPNLGDVRTAEFPHADIICAGFPCQDISIANQNPSGLAGDRSGLFWQIIRALRLVGRPRLVLENVAELLNRGMAEVLGAFSALGYHVQWHCIPASAVGASQERDRVWLVADPAEERTTRLLTSADIGEARQRRSSGSAHLLDIANAPFERGDSHPEPLVRGLARRVPGRVDRVGACGNAIDPAIAELIGHTILASIAHEREAA